MSWVPIHTAKHSVWLRWLVLRRSERALRTLARVHIATVTLATADQILEFACTVPLPGPTPSEVLYLWEPLFPTKPEDEEDRDTIWDSEDERSHTTSPSSAQSCGEDEDSADDQIDDDDFDLTTLEESTVTTSSTEKVCCPFWQLDDLLPLDIIATISRDLSLVLHQFPEQTVPLLISTRTTRVRAPAYCNHLLAGIQAQEARAEQRSIRRRRLLQLSLKGRLKPTPRSPLSQMTLVGEANAKVDVWEALATSSQGRSVISGYSDGTPVVDLQNVQW